MTAQLKAHFKVVPIQTGDWWHLRLSGEVEISLP